MTALPEPTATRAVNPVRSRLGGYTPLARVYRRYRPSWLWRATSPFAESTERYIEENGLRVKRGPFESMAYVEEAVGKANHLASKLAGAYEPAVCDFMAEQASRHDLVVDLGSGEGFFCVGLAMLEPIRTIGFEVNAFERRLTRRIAAANGVEVETRGEVGRSDLNDLPPGRLLLLCDVEGLEEDLLDPQAVPRLREATMMVEVHEEYRPGVRETLRRRFEATHEIEQYEVQPIDLADFPELEAWPDETARWAVFDGHLPGQGWMSFVPR